MCDHSEHICSSDPLEYVKTIYKFNKKGQPAEKAVKMAIENMVKFAEKHLPLEKGLRMIDIGSGATLHTEMVLSKYYDTIYMSDFQSEANDLVKKWLKNEDPGFDWNLYLSYIAKLEGSSSEDIEKRVKATVKDVVSCDIFEADVGIPQNLQETPFDAVASIGVLAVNAKELTKYRQTLENTLSLLKPGGFFIYDDCLEGGWKVKTIKDELAKAGVEILEWAQSGSGGFVEFLALCKKPEEKATNKRVRPQKSADAIPEKRTRASHKSDKTDSKASDSSVTSADGQTKVAKNKKKQK